MSQRHGGSEIRTPGDTAYNEMLDDFESSGRNIVLKSNDTPIE